MKMESAVLDAEAEQCIKQATQQFEETVRKLLATVLAKEARKYKALNEELTALNKGCKSEGAIAAMAHLAQGKRNLVVNDVKAAVECFEKACAAFAEQFGETADECGEAYYCYGSALLELARLETGVIAVGEGRTDDESTDDETKEETEPKANGNEAGKMEESKDTDTDGDEDMEHDDAAEGEEGAEVDTAAVEEEDVSTLQLAWEILELAKNIFYRQSKECKEMEIKLSETFLKLGEVSLESENYAQSIDDLCQCLFIRQKLFTPDDRKIAEVHYQLGNSYNFDKQYMKAKVQYDLSLKVLNKRIHKLKEAIAFRKPGKTATADVFYTEEGEIEEIEKILPEIAEKLADMEDLEKDVKTATCLSPRLEKAIRSTAQAVSSLATEMRDTAQAKILEFGEGSSKMEETATTVTAKDISHLVKRKRESLEGESAKATEAKIVTKSPTLKKVKVAGGPVVTNGTTNGVTANGNSH